MVTALAFIPAGVVRQAWALPLYSAYVIPVMVVALLLAGRNVLCEEHLT
jgi:hypothetical protein